MHTLYAIRHLHTVVRLRQIYLQTLTRTLSTGVPSASMPWFVDPEDIEPPAFVRRPIPPHLPEVPYQLPSGIPEPVRVLYNELSTSPYLEPSTLVAREPPQIPPGPPLPVRLPHGRRKRGGTYAGESCLDSSGGIWNWVIMAQVMLVWSVLGTVIYTYTSCRFLQVKEGTEHRGAIESVVRVVRKTVREIL